MEGRNLNDSSNYSNVLHENLYLEYKDLFDRLEELNAKEMETFIFLRTNYKDILEKEAVKYVLRENQEKLKYISEYEKDLPFKSVRNEGGLFMIEGIDAIELESKIGNLYAEARAKSMTDEEIKAFKENFVADITDMDSIRLFEHLPEDIGSREKTMTSEGIKDVERYNLEEPITIQTTTILKVELKEYYKRQHNLEFVDKENNSYKIYLGTINDSPDMKLILKTREDDLIYSYKLDKAYQRGELNLSDVIDVDKNEYLVIGNIRNNERESHELQMGKEISINITNSMHVR